MKPCTDCEYNYPVFVGHCEVCKQTKKRLYYVEKKPKPVKCDSWENNVRYVDKIGGRFWIERRRMFQLGKLRNYFALNFNDETTHYLSKIDARLLSRRILQALDDSKKIRRNNGK